MKFTILFFVLNSGCRDIRKNEKNEPVKILSGHEIIQVTLPESLKEISGLAASKDGRLFAHDDEKGIIYEIEPDNGKIVKRFQVGAIGIAGDFEGIAIAGDQFFLIESRGELFVFEEGTNNSSVSVNSFNLNFSSKFDIEGLCYDSASNSLLIACKEYAGKKNKNARAVFSCSLKDFQVNPEPRFVIKLEEIEKEIGSKDFYPSGIDYNSFTKTFFIISSKEQPAIVEISPKGELLSAKKLNKKLHPQPEGITFLSDGRMVISDEGGGGKATLTIYPADKKK